MNYAINHTVNDAGLGNSAVQESAKSSDSTISDKGSKVSSPAHESSKTSVPYYPSHILPRCDSDAAKLAIENALENAENALSGKIRLLDWRNPRLLDNSSSEETICTATFFTTKGTDDLKYKLFFANIDSNKWFVEIYPSEDTEDK